MDLPIYYPFDEFKRTVCMNKQNPVHQRIAFQDFGCSGHVDVVFDKAASQPDMRIIPQRRQLSLQDRNHFCASLPTIPLRDTPVPGAYLKIQLLPLNHILVDLPDFMNSA